MTSMAPDDVAAKVLVKTGPREDPAAKSAAFVQYPQQYVLGLDGARAKLAGLGTRVKEDPRRSYREAIKYTPA